jgi:hypothetical protein
MKDLIIKVYPSNVEIFKGDFAYTISTDGTIGEFTRQEWADSDDFEPFTKEEKEEILDAMERKRPDIFSKE